MESTKPLIKNSRKKALVIGSRSGNEYLEENRFSRFAVVFALALAFAILTTAPVSRAERGTSTFGDDEQKHHRHILPDKLHTSEEDEQRHHDGQAISASTPPATSNCGPMCYECMR